jgi:hypothetical protein
VVKAVATDRRMTVSFDRAGDAFHPKTLHSVVETQAR